MMRTTLVKSLVAVAVLATVLLSLSACTTDSMYTSPWERLSRRSTPADKPPQQLAQRQPDSDVMTPMPGEAGDPQPQQNNYIGTAGYSYTPRQANTRTPGTDSSLKTVPAPYVQQNGNQQPNNVQTYPAQRPGVTQAPAAYQGSLQHAPQMAIHRAPITGPVVKVGLLLPLSGPHKDLGESMLNAAQMALFEVGDRRLKLMPRDTRGTPDGAREALRSAAQDGAQLILGPVFGESVRAVKSIARSKRLNVVAFTTDWSVAGGNVFTMGFLPHQQVERVINYAGGRGYSSFGVLAPRSDYGDIVVQSFHKTLSAIPYVTEPIPSARYSPNSANISAIVREFVDYDARVEALEEERRKWEDDKSPEAEAIMAELELMQTMGDPPFTAVMLAAGGDQVRALANLLRFYDINLKQVKLLGTGLWDDPTLPNEENMHGAWFAAPSPKNRIGFESRYVKMYGERPLRLATLAYDATALAAVLGHKGLVSKGSPAFDARYITNPNGFAGVDGIFRFSRGGLVERGLAVLEVRERGIFVIDEAPKSFLEKANQQKAAQQRVALPPAQEQPHYSNQPRPRYEPYKPPRQPGQ